MNNLKGLEYVVMDNPALNHFSYNDNYVVVTIVEALRAGYGVEIGDILFTTEDGSVYSSCNAREWADFTENLKASQEY